MDVSSRRERRQIHNGAANIRCIWSILLPMRVKSSNERIIFGLKVKQLRQARGLSFADLAKETGMSVSYLNEIEKGKKYPKADKIAMVAAALGAAVGELTNGELDRSLAPVAELLRSNFLNELPLDLFGIELNKVAEIIANAPVRVGAFISTLLQLSRNYAVREENFYFGALRAFLELNDNYFPELETAADQFIEVNKLPSKRPLAPLNLQRILEDLYGYTIIHGGLDPYPELADLRSVFLPEERLLLLNSSLSAQQQAFQFGKELAFNHLQLTDRANTSSIIRGRVFEEVLNHAYATYFSVALHLPLQAFLVDMKRFFELSSWDAQAYIQIMQRYLATPEMFYHRLTNVIPRYFQMPKLFFIRFVHDLKQETFTVDKELHLNRRHQPHGNGLFEHYCRRWVSVDLLKQLPTGATGEYLVQVQRSRYVGTEDEYLCLTIARSAYPKPHTNVSVTLGLLVNEDVERQIRWLNDPAIRRRQVGTTCERCPIEDCKERVAEPVVIQKRNYHRRTQAGLERLREDFKERVSSS